SFPTRRSSDLGVGLGSVISRGWQDGQYDLGLLTGEGREKGDNLGVFLVVIHTAQLQATHDVNSLGQGPNCPIVEIRVRQLDVTQCGDLKAKAVSIHAGYLDATLGRVKRVVRLDDAHLLE